MRKIFISILFVFLVIGSILFYTHRYHGLFTPYNYWTAKSAIENGEIHVATFGELSINHKEESILASKYGFSYTSPSCVVTPAIMNGIKSYNAVIFEYLDKENGKGWKDLYDEELENLISSSKNDIEIESDCVFDLNTQSDEFMKRLIDYQDYSWNDESKTATIILNNSDTLKLSRGGCTHFYYTTYYSTQISDSMNLKNEELIFNYATKLANNTFPESDVALINNLIEQGLYNSDIGSSQHFYQFDQDNYCSMTLFINELDNILTFEFSYYLC